MSVGLPRKRIVGERKRIGGRGSSVSSEGGIGGFVRGNSVINKEEIESVEQRICQKMLFPKF